MSETSSGLSDDQSTGKVALDPSPGNRLYPQSRWGKIALAIALAVLLAGVGLTVVGISFRHSERTELSPGPADPDSIQPGRSVGPVALGERREDLLARLGSGRPDPIQGGGLEWDVRGGTVAASFDAEGRVQSVRTNSAKLSLGGHSLSEGLPRMRKAFPDWAPLRCGGIRALVFNHSRSGPSSTIQYFVGPSIPYARQVGFPIFRLSSRFLPLRCVA